MTMPLPDFPRPDLPEAHPENFPTLRIRVMRRLGLPDDGGLWLSDAINPGVLRGYHGIVTEDDADRILIEFASLADAVSWAGLVTPSGRDRSTIAFAETPVSPYAPVTIQVTLR